MGNIVVAPQQILSEGTNNILISSDNIYMANDGVSLTEKIKNTTEVKFYLDEGDGINLTEVDPILENNSWETIQKVARTGKADQVWSVGDKKSITLRDYDYNSQYYNDMVTYYENTFFYAVIIGFNHNSEIEDGANNTITFQCMETYDGKIFGFHRSKWRPYSYTYFGSFGLHSGYFVSVSTSGGKTEYTAKYGRARYHSGNIYNAVLPLFENTMLPIEVAKVIKKVGRYNYEAISLNEFSNGNELSSSMIQLCSGCFILSTYELFGEANKSPSIESQYQKQYEYYKNNGVGMKYIGQTSNGNINVPSSSPSDSAIECLRSDYYYNKNFIIGGCNSIQYNYTSDNYTIASFSSNEFDIISPCFAVG